MGWVGMCWVLGTRMGSVLVAQLPMISSLKASSLQLWLISCVTYADLAWVSSHQKPML